MSNLLPLSTIKELNAQQIEKEFNEVQCRFNLELYQIDADFEQVYRSMNGSWVNVGPYTKEVLLAELSFLYSIIEQCNLKACN